MSFNVKDWLVSLGIKAEDADGMAAKFDANQAAAIAEQTQNAATHKAAMADVAKTQADLKSANDKFNAEIAEWSTMTAAEQAKAGKLREQMEASDRKVFDLQQKLTRLATDHGVDPKTLIEVPVAPPVAPPAAPPVDTSKFVAVDQYGASLSYSLQLPFKLHQIAQEHHAITGAHLSQSDLDAIHTEIVSRATSKKGDTIDPVAIWESKYDIPAKRAAKAAAERAAEIKAAEDKGYERARSEGSLPASTPPGRQSPVLRGAPDQHGKTQPRQSVLSRPAPQSTVLNAASALRSGKYRKSA